MKLQLSSPLSFAITLAAVVLFGCEQQPVQQANAPTPDPETATAGLPTDLFVETAPEGARSVADIKADATATGPVVVTGRIGGRPEPFVEGAAVFLIADAEMKDCKQLHGDGCPTPWDYCCEPPDSLAAKIATIQIVDPDGKPLHIDVSGEHGLNPLATVTIAGEIARRGEGSLVINAQQIHVAEQPS